MKLETFLNKLDKWYNVPIKGTNAICKFYAQATTFSYEIHDTRETCFTQKSLKYSSDVYSFWISDSKERSKIIKDIKQKAIEISKK